MQFVPLLLLRRHQHQHQIGAHGKVHGLVGDDHRVKIRIESLQSFVQHRDQVRADGVHLRVKLAAHHAVAEVDQAGAGIPLDLAARLFLRFQNDHAGRRFHRLGRAALHIENSGLPFLRFIKSFSSACQYFLHQRRYRAAFLLDLRRKRSHADRVHHFERSHLPRESPLHRVVHVHDVVGNLRYAPRRVQAHLRQSAPNKLTALCRPPVLPAPAPRARAAALACPQSLFPYRATQTFAFWRGRYSIVFKSSVRISFSPSPLTFL